MMIIINACLFHPDPAPYDHIEVKNKSYYSAEASFSTEAKLL
jgi:hypothetical protein